MKAKGQLRRNKSKIFVKEHLTPKNNNIFYKAREAKCYRIFSHVWSESGRIWATHNANDSPILLRDHEVIAAEIERAIGEGIEPMESEDDKNPPPHHHLPIQHAKEIKAMPIQQEGWDQLNSRFHQDSKT